MSHIPICAPLCQANKSTISAASSSIGDGKAHKGWIPVMSHHIFHDHYHGFAFEKASHQKYMEGSIVAKLLLLPALIADQLASHGYINTSKMKTTLCNALAWIKGMANHCLSNPCIELLVASHWVLVHKADSIHIAQENFVIIYISMICW